MTKNEYIELATAGSRDCIFPLQVPQKHHKTLQQRTRFFLLSSEPSSGGMAQPEPHPGFSN